MGRWNVGDVMTTDVVSVHEDAPFRDVAERLENSHVSALPVVNGGNLVVGVVSEADLMKMEFAGQHDRPRLFEGRRIRTARGKAAGRVAGDLMTSPAVTIMSHSSVAEAARLMDSAGVKRLPVVNLAGRLVGIVSRYDLLKVFVRPDADIRSEVRREYLQLPGVDAARIVVEVDDGVVTLGGKVKRRSLMAPVVRLAEQVDGVVAVVSMLTYEVDDTLQLTGPII
jgi:CBS domain-containing protein